MSGEQHPDVKMLEKKSSGSKIQRQVQYCHHIVNNGMWFFFADQSIPDSQRDSWLFASQGSLITQQVVFRRIHQNSDQVLLTSPFPTETTFWRDLISGLSILVSRVLRWVARLALQSRHTRRLCCSITIRQSSCSSKRQERDILHSLMQFLVTTVLLVSSLDSEDRLSGKMENALTTE